MEKQNNGVITDKNFKSNKIEPISNMAIDIMNTGLPLELAEAVAIDLYEKGYRKERQGVEETVDIMVEMLKNRIHNKFAYYGWYLKETIIEEIAKEMKGK